LHGIGLSFKVDNIHGSNSVNSAESRISILHECSAPPTLLPSRHGMRSQFEFDHFFHLQLIGREQLIFVQLEVYEMCILCIKFVIELIPPSLLQKNWHRSWAHTRCTNERHHSDSLFV